MSREEELKEKKAKVRELYKMAEELSKMNVMHSESIPRFDDESVQEFYMTIFHFFLKKRQKEAIEKGLF